MKTLSKFSHDMKRTWFQILKMALWWTYSNHFWWGKTWLQKANIRKDPNRQICGKHLESATDVSIACLLCPIIPCTHIAVLFSAVNIQSITDTNYYSTSVHITSGFVYSTFFFSTGFYSPYAPWPSLMDFLIHRHLVGLLGWGIIPMQGLYRHTRQHNTVTCRHTSMPRAGFKPAISMFKWS
jgi:hypothetical protein